MCDQLPAFGNRPNCVCGRDNAPTRHRVEPFDASGDPEAAFARLKDLLAGMPHTTIVTSTEEYVHAVCRTRLGFADDVECRLCSVDGVIHVRSASRLGYYDFGVNRARVEALRQGLRSG